MSDQPAKDAADFGRRIPGALVEAMAKCFGSSAGPVVGLLGVLVLFVALVANAGELQRFLSLGNLQVLLHDNTIPAVAALGMLLVIVSGGIDLSVGSVVALVTVVTMRVYNALYEQTNSTTIASLAAIAAGLGTGGGCGLANGSIVTLFRVPPFVATLGMYSIARGLAIWLAGRQLLTFRSGSRPAWVDALTETQGGYGIFYPGFWSLGLLAVVTALLLRRTVLGRYIYAVGSNEAAARLCGVAITPTKLAVYTLAGFLNGWAGLLSFAHVSSGDPSGNVGFELIVIASVVIGGASLSGGRGTVVGTLLGVLIWGVIDNGVNTLSVAVEVKYIVIGAFFLLNTALSQWQRQRAE
jgi:ribose transport system permease protein